MHDGNGNGWLSNELLGNGRLGDGQRKDLAMDGLTAMQRQWSDLTTMDSLMAMAMNGLAMDSSAINGTMAWRWTA